MPIITIQVAATRQAELTTAIAARVGELTRTVLRKDPALTAIVVQYVDPQDWIIAGRSLAERGQSSFFLDIRITDETNTKDEKAAYVAAIFQAFADLLPPLNEESYVHVHDVRAAAYGYGGRTQEYRYQHPPVA